MKSKVSVVIPTYNSSKTLRESIQTLLEQSIKPSEIIIVNNASTDDTEKMVKREFSSVNLINLQSNTGVTGGRNVGADKASCDYILFFDHDMDAKQNMVEELLKVAELKKDIGIVTPKIYFWDDKDIIWSAGTDVNLWNGQTIFYGGRDAGQFNENREVAVAPAVLLVKREVIKKIGLFDNTYFATYEDTDFCFRAKKAGYRTFYAANAIAYHRIPYDNVVAMKRLLARTYWVGRNRIIFMKRYGKNFFVFLLFMPIFALHYTVLAIKFKNLHSIMNYYKGVFAGLVTS